MGRSERALSEVADGQGGVRATGDWGDDLPVAEGVSLTEPKTLDLAAADPATGKPAHQIIKTTDPQKYGILVSDDLIA
jgi:hypothetical protein